MHFLFLGARLPLARATKQASSNDPVMPEEISTWLAYDGRSFPSGDWREYLRAFHVKWSRTRHTDIHPIWYAIEGRGFVVWVSEPDWFQEHWRISLGVSASAPPAALALIDQILTCALVEFSQMRIEKPLGPEEGSV
jgi:hypothetical protein